MLVSRSARVSNICTATPGWERMPAPMIRELADLRIGIDLGDAQLVPHRPSARSAVRRSSEATVNDTSASRPSSPGSFWMIVSTLQFAVEHLLEAQRRKLARLWHDPAIARKHPRHIGIDLAGLSSAAAIATTVVSAQGPERFFCCVALLLQSRCDEANRV